MILTIDIGNTNIHTGFYHNNKMVSGRNFATRDGINKNFFKAALNKKNIEGIGIASVVPALTQKLISRLEKNFGIKPVVIGSTLRMPVKIAYKNLGADRIANIAAGFFRYHRNLIIFAFGTAITGDVVLKNGIHLGGIILPGPKTQLWSLKQKTALLKNIKLKIPRGVLGKNTNECIQSGITNGIKFCIQGFIRKIKKETGKNYIIIATGGEGKHMSQLIPEIEYYDPDLTHYGILKLFYENV